MPLLDHPGNWPEDFPDDNGNYMNICVNCEQPFLGHKRRSICKICADVSREKWATMDDDQKLEVTKKQEAEIKAWIDGRQHLWSTATASKATRVNAHRAVLAGVSAVIKDMRKIRKLRKAGVADPDIARALNLAPDSVLFDTE